MIEERLMLTDHYQFTSEGTFCLMLLWKRRQVTEVLCATVIRVGALEFLRSYW